MLMLGKQTHNKHLLNVSSTCWSVFTLQEVKELLLKGQVPPDSKSCLDRFLVTEWKDEDIKPDRPAINNSR